MARFSLHVFAIIGVNYLIVRVSTRWLDKRANFPYCLTRVDDPLGGGRRMNSFHHIRHAAIPGAGAAVGLVLALAVLILAAAEASRWL